MSQISNHINEAMATSYGRSKSSIGSRLAWLFVKEEIEFWRSDMGIRIVSKEGVDLWMKKRRPDPKKD